MWRRSSSMYWLRPKRPTKPHSRDIAWRSRRRCTRHARRRRGLQTSACAPPPRFRQRGRPPSLPIRLAIPKPPSPAIATSSPSNPVTRRDSTFWVSCCAILAGHPKRVAFAAALAAAHAYIEPRVALANLYREQGLTGEAVTLCEEGLRLAPDEVTLWRALGLARLAQRDGASARPAFHRAVQLEPNDATT